MVCSVKNMERPEIISHHDIVPEEKYLVTISVAGENEGVSAIIEVAKNRLFEVIMSLSGHTSVITIE